MAKKRGTSRGSNPRIEKPKELPKPEVLGTPAPKPAKGLWGEVKGLGHKQLAAIWLLGSFAILALLILVLVWQGHNVSQQVFYVLLFFLSLLPSVGIFGLGKHSFAALEWKDIWGTACSLGGAIAVWPVAFCLLINNILPAQSKPIQFVVIQGNATYRGSCDVEYQIPPANNLIVEIQGGSKTLTGIPAGTKEIRVWRLSAFGVDYVPKGHSGTPPYKLAIDETGTATLNLGPLPTKTSCKPFTIKEMTAWFEKRNKLPEVKEQVEKAKDDEKRAAIKSKKFLRFINETHIPAVLLGIDCRRLFELPDEFDFEDSDWQDFVEFDGQDAHEIKDYNGFPSTEKTSGLYCMFACVTTPEGKQAVYLGLYDFFDHEVSHYQLIKSGNTVELHLVPPSERKQ
jgi:hypothetical protein